MRLGGINMLLFSYANWDEIVKVCMGLCGNDMGNKTEGIKNDNLWKPGEGPGQPNRVKDPMARIQDEWLEKEKEVTTV